jgi:hypothetical protein
VVSGLLNMTRGIGTALGVALASAVYIAAYRASSSTAPPTAAANGLTAAMATLGGIALVAGAMLLLRPETASAEEPHDDAVAGGNRRRWPSVAAAIPNQTTVVTPLCAEVRATGRERFTAATLHRRETHGQPDGPGGHSLPASGGACPFCRWGWPRSRACGRPWHSRDGTPATSWSASTSRC